MNFCSCVEFIVIGVIFQSYMVTSQKYFGSCKHLFDMVRWILDAVHVMESILIRL